MTSYEVQRVELIEALELAEMRVSRLLDEVGPGHPLRDRTEALKEAIRDSQRWADAVVRQGEV